MTVFRASVIFLCSLIPLHTCHADEVYNVQRVIDGDTLELENSQRVRLIGIDTPEIIDDQGRNARTAQWTGVDRRVIDDFALKAKEFVKQWIEGDAIRLEFDPANQGILHHDKFGRLLAYVYRVSDNESLNQILVSKGYALTYRRFQFKERERYLTLEEDAKQSGRGLWGSRDLKPLPWYSRLLNVLK